jgi:hypothetical protein
MNEFETNKAYVTSRYEELINRKNRKADSYNGIYDRYVNPVLTAEHAPIIWKYDLDPATNPHFMERLGINAVLNSGAIYLNGKYCLVARVEGSDRKSFFAVAESDSPTEGFRFRDYPVILPDTEPDETNVYDMRLTQHEDGWIYGVFCSESKDTSVNDLSAATAQAGIVRTKDLVTWERLPNLRSKSPQQRNVVLHPEFVDGKYAFYTRPQDDFIETALMSLIFEGRFYAFPPVTYLPEAGVTVIRPMMYVPEKGVANFVINQGIKVVKNTCPVDGSTKREYAKQLMEQINRDNPGTKDRIMHAVVNGRFEDWPEVHRN